MLIVPGLILDLLFDVLDFGKVVIIVDMSCVMLAKQLCSQVSLWVWTMWSDKCTTGFKQSNTPCEFVYLINRPIPRSTINYASPQSTRPHFSISDHNLNYKFKMYTATFTIPLQFEANNIQLKSFGSVYHFHHNFLLVYFPFRNHIHSRTN